MKLRLVGLFIGALTAFAQQSGSGTWVATWATAQPLARFPAAPRPANAATPPPSAPPNPLRAINATGFNDQTVRMMVRTSIGGSRVRIKLANPFGGMPVTVGAAHIAVHGEGNSGIAPGSDHVLAFSGKPTFTIGPGVVIYSDPIDMQVAPNSDLAVSLYFPTETGPPAAHNGLRSSYVAAGNVTSATDLTEPLIAPAYYFLAALDVHPATAAQTIVTLGDSITEGARSTPDTNHQWPTLLAARLAADKATANIAVANVGIGGNRLLRDNSGASALARLDRDVFSQSGVKWMTLMEGINDIGRSVTVPAEVVTVDELIAGYKQIIERAHAFGIRIAGCTLTPYEGAGYYTEAGEAVRVAANTWIRTSGAFDAVIDFEAAVRDPQNPKKLRAEFDPGDHLHPNDAGYQAMADSMNLSVFAAPAQR